LLLLNIKNITDAQLQEIVDKVERLTAIGLTDEITDRYYVVVDGTDGRVHYADIGIQRPGMLPEIGMIVSLEATEQDSSNRQQTRLRILSYLNLEKLTGTDGATWLDRELASKGPTHIADHGFGADVEAALRNRLQWLAEQGLSQPIEDGTMRPTASVLNDPKRRETQLTADSITARSGLSHVKPLEGEQFSGTCKHSVNLTSGKYAIIENAKEFVLVPWRPSLEDMRGKVLSGVAGLNRNWEFVSARHRGLGI
jgi:Protein of unknown function (DUF3363)